MRRRRRRRLEEGEDEAVEAMTPLQHHRFLLSLRQLNQRLAAEPPSQPPLGAHTPPPAHRSIPPDAHTTSLLARLPQQPDGPARPPPLPDDRHPNAAASLEYVFSGTTNTGIFESGTLAVEVEKGRSCLSPEQSDGNKVGAMRGNVSEICSEDGSFRGEEVIPAQKQAASQLSDDAVIKSTHHLLKEGQRLEERVQNGVLNVKSMATVHAKASDLTPILSDKVEKRNGETAFKVDQRVVYLLNDRNDVATLEKDTADVQPNGKRSRKERFEESGEGGLQVSWNPRNDQVEEAGAPAVSEGQCLKIGNERKATYAEEKQNQGDCREWHDDTIELATHVLNSEGCKGEKRLNEVPVTPSFKRDNISSKAESQGEDIAFSERWTNQCDREHLAKQHMDMTKAPCGSLEQIELKVGPGHEVCNTKAVKEHMCDGKGLILADVGEGFDCEVAGANNYPKDTSQELVCKEVDSLTSVRYQQTGVLNFGNAAIASETESSSCPIFFPTDWNPWSAHGGSGLMCTESNPPAEFVSPLNVETAASEWIGEESEQDLDNLAQEFDDDASDLQNMLNLCSVLNLNGDQLLTDKCGLQKENDDHNSDSECVVHCSDAPGVRHEKPGSDFYSKVAMVGESKCDRHAKAVDTWIQRLATSQTEPYCLAVLLIAKASLQKCESLETTESTLQFPRILEEWFTF